MREHLLVCNVNQNFDLILIGASTRSVGHSALRAGFRPICLDQFADSDIAALAPVRQVPLDSHKLAVELERLPPTPLIYAGGVENHPELLAAAEQRHQVWGNSAAVVKRVRDPRELSEAAQLARVGIPESRSESQAPPADGEWIIRPLRGSGGRGIHVWDAAAADCDTLREPHQFQKRIRGAEYSAIFLAAAAPGDVRFVGVTQQLVGWSECHARDFQWCGNIGPVALPIQVEHLVRRLGNILKWKLGLKGLFGLDFMVDGQGMPWVTEVNPRYPASLELLEHSTGTSLLSDHVMCFAGDRVPPRTWNRAHPGEFLGKAVYYAARRVRVNEPLAQPRPGTELDFPEMADLPAAGSVIETGHPVCTVFATGTTLAETHMQLRAELALLDHSLTDAT